MRRDTAGTAALGGRKNAVFVRQLETVILRVGNLLAPKEHGGVQGCCFKAAVRANLPGRAADIHFLTVGKTVINTLRHNEGLVFLPRGTLSRETTPSAVRITSSTPSLPLTVSSSG